MNDLLDHQSPLSKIVSIEYLNNLSQNYKDPFPFNNVVIKGMWDREYLKKVEIECKNHTEWNLISNHQFTTAKRQCNNIDRMGVFTANLIKYCHSKYFLSLLSKITNIKGIKVDPNLYGGGIHSILNNGYSSAHPL